jgi:ABC-type transport system involved in multi-copper enzyme maturation permease subunit
MYNALWYKSWRESQTRFLLSGMTMATLCALFALFRNEADAAMSGEHRTYAEFIWRAVYKGYLREMFVILALLLGVGGLLRERDAGTSGFTLALPASRLTLVLVRAATGLIEVAILSTIPALVLPPISALTGQYYPAQQAWQFALLWTAGGSFIFMIGFLASSIFGGSYTAPVISFLTLLVYSLISDLPGFDKYGINIHDLMSGNGAPWFDMKGATLTGPLPWAPITLLMFFVIGCVFLAGGITPRQDF